MNKETFSIIKAYLGGFACVLIVVLFFLVCRSS